LATIAAGLAAASCATAQAADYETWDGYLGGGESSQYSSLDQINRENVSRLEVAWTYGTGERGAYRFNPLVVDGVMYVLAHQNSLVALNAATGEEIWRLANEGRVASRGMTYWASEDGSDRRLFLTVGGMLTAINAQTGQIIETFGEGGRVDLRTGLAGDVSEVRPLQTDNPGRVFEDLIIMSLPAGAYAYQSSPADIHAYDVRTGELRWTFNVVPRPGEVGGDSWPERDREKFGGVHNWSESTIDTENGIIYIPTGTARYDFYGGNRPGDNLFSDSVVALDARTGERLWHFQTVHHDLWDYDLPTAPKLLTLTRDGEEIPALVQPTKTGFVFAFNRLTGEPIWPIEERPVPASDVPGEHASPTQPFPSAPPPFERQSFTEADINPHLTEADQAKLREQFSTHRSGPIFTPPSLVGTLTLPGHSGGTNWGGSAVDPESARLFVVSKAFPTRNALVVPDADAPAQPVPNGDEDFVAYNSPVDFMFQSNGLPAVSPPWSTITAYDMNKGEILWQVPNGEVMTLAAQGIRDTGSVFPRGGLAVTAGGLVFVATSSDRKFRARDVDTGEVLWEVDTPAASEGVPAVYEVDGRQYVTIPVGGVGQFNQGLGLPEPGPGQYMTFALPEE
jgi:quinoprotein glucose dehydrogenase